jgi:hypothetical protein
MSTRVPDLAPPVAGEALAQGAQNRLTTLREFVAHGYKTMGYGST